MRLTGVEGRFLHRMCSSGQRRGSDRRIRLSVSEQKTDLEPAKEAEVSKQPAVDWKILASVGAVILTGVGNRLLYKMALVPLDNYVFFLAQLQTFGYVIVYFTFLALRYRSGIVTKPMLEQLPVKFFLLIGLCEAFSSLLGFIGAARLPGVVLPLLAQSIMLWQILLSKTVLGRDLTMFQYAGAALVAAGVCTAAFPSSSGNILAEVAPIYALIYVASTFFPAAASVVKDKIFSAAKERLGGGQQLDIFVVNSFGSLCQALFVFLLLPVLTSLRGMSFSELPQYIVEGCSCLLGTTPACSGAPQLPLGYIAANLAFNIAALNLLREAGNVVVTVTMSAVVPLSIWAFTMPWPMLPPSPALSTRFFLGVSVLMAGLFTFNYEKLAPFLSKGDESSGK